MARKSIRFWPVTSIHALINTKFCVISVSPTQVWVAGYPAELCSKIVVEFAPLEGMGETKIVSSTQKETQWGKNEHKLGA